MARLKKDDDVRKYAVIGARARLMVLRDEMQFILDRFPELTAEDSSGARPRPAGSAVGAKAGGWRMSDEAKKAVSLRMKKYWAARRRAKAAADKGARA